MSGGKSALFQQFADSVRGGDPAWKEQVDEDALLALSGDERAEAESLLIAKLDKDDWRAPPALVKADARRSIPALRDRLATAKGKMRLAIGKALIDFGDREDMDDVIAEVLREKDDPTSTGPIAALVRAESRPTEVVKKALQRAAIEHPDPVVRIGAASRLLYLSGAAKAPMDWDQRPFFLRFGEEDRAELLDAYRELCQRAGRSPDLGESHA
jgi:hypothetical protein